MSIERAEAAQLFTLDVRMAEIGYREVLGGDVVNDGMYLELHDPEDRVVAVVFRSDAGEFEIHLASEGTPSDVIERFVQRAKRTLTDRNV
jgi:hypothetical protein